MKIILWDWDNTLVDSVCAIWIAQNITRAQFGLPAWSKAQTRLSMNKSGEVLFSELFGEKNKKRAKEIYLEAYENASAKLRLKKGAREILKWAKQQGFTNILASNKTGCLLRKEVAIKGLSSFFVRIVGAGDTSCYKPSVGFSDFALRGFKNFDLYVIGDGESDLLMGENYPQRTAILVNKTDIKQSRSHYYCQNLLQVKSFLQENKK